MFVSFSGALESFTARLTNPPKLFEHTGTKFCEPPRPTEYSVFAGIRIRICIRWWVGIFVICIRIRTPHIRIICIRIIWIICIWMFHYLPRRAVYLQISCYQCSNMLTMHILGRPMFLERCTHLFSSLRNRAIHVHITREYAWPGELMSDWLFSSILLNFASTVCPGHLVMPPNRWGWPQHCLVGLLACPMGVYGQPPYTGVPSRGG